VLCTPSTIPFLPPLPLGLSVVTQAFPGRTLLTSLIHSRLSFRKCPTDNLIVFFFLLSTSVLSCAPASPCPLRQPMLSCTCLFSERPVKTWGFTSGVHIPSNRILFFESALLLQGINLFPSDFLTFFENRLARSLRGGSFCFVTLFLLGQIELAPMLFNLAVWTASSVDWPFLFF